MLQQVRNTETFLMMEFAAKMKPFVGKPQDEARVAMKQHGQPVVDRLRESHGYTLADASSLVQSVWRRLCEDRGAPWRLAPQQLPH
jgi:hypothetical protein